MGEGHPRGQENTTTSNKQAVLKKHLKAVRGTEWEILLQKNRKKDIQTKHITTTKTDFIK